MVNQYLTKEARAHNGVKTVSSVNGIGRTGQVYANDETRAPPYSMHKKKVKWIKDLNIDF